MLAAAPINDALLSVAEVASLLRPQTVTGATIITHGFQLSDSGGDSLTPLAQAVLNRADIENGANETAWLLDYDLVNLGGHVNGRFDSAQSALPNPTVSATGEVVLLFDWARESNESSAGWGEAAGDALFNLLVSLGLAFPLTGTSVPLHLIGHSFGTAVTGEAVERLATFRILVDQVTYLDPHDFDEPFLPIDGPQRLYDLGRPDGYGATVWNNVSFTDVYYQTESVPRGRPIPGAYNLLVNDQVDGFDAHSKVWSISYLSTAGDANSTTGYGFSRVARLARPDLRDNANQVFRFYSQPTEAQDHAFSPASLTDHGKPLNQNEVNFAQWKPLWNPLEIVNGDFQYAGDELLAGWVDHGGGRVLKGACPGGFPCGDAFDGSLSLGARTGSRTHNRSYIPASATSVLFDLKRTDASDDDQLVVRIGEQVVASLALNSVDESFRTHVAAIPPELRNGSHTLEIAILTSGPAIDSDVQIDNLRLAGWQNPANLLDVSGDHLTVAQDALIVINEINDRRISAADGRLPLAPPTGYGPPYYDIDGDGFVVATDAIIVINYVNSAAAEGESSSPFLVVPVDETLCSNSDSPATLLLVSNANESAMSTAPRPPKYRNLALSRANIIDAAFAELFPSDAPRRRHYMAVLHSLESALEGFASEVTRH